MNDKIISFIKLICIFHLIIFLPKIISLSSNDKNGISNKKPKVLLGIQNLTSNPQKFDWIKKLNVGLVCDKEEKMDLNGNKIIDLLLQQGFNIKKIFIPSKNKSNSQQPNFITSYKNTKIPLFVWNSSSSLLSQNNLANLDAIIFDMSDSGLRHDLCFTTLLKTMQSAAKENKRVIVLDRPNPLGSCMEGPGSIPFRYGMTPGELAFYLNRYALNKSINLTVIPMTNWRRNKPFLHLDLPQIQNLTTSLNTYYGYSFLSPLNEIKPINTTSNKLDAFQTILLPEENQLSIWEVDYLKKICSKLGIFCKNHSFEDYNKKINLKGVKIRIKKDINNFSSFNTFLTLARFLNNRKNINFSYSQLFDGMLGTQDTREFLQGLISYDDLKNKIDDNLDVFYSKSKNCFLYKPYPKINHVEIIKG